MTRQQHEVKPVFNLIDAVFDGNAGHVAAPAKELAFKYGGLVSAPQVKRKPNLGDYGTRTDE
jgi:hypothetical protein